MSPPTDDSRPRLASGTRWAPPTTGGMEETRMILFPEGVIKLQGTGRLVLERCDGQRTFGEILTDLQKEFDKTDADKIRIDISTFLEQLQKKRIIDY
ncbi:MAG TPA: pyrroloquinoline quinone biosynthesis peptide chaperone PqqD [Candidatus Sulfotelmatobacter sp.]|nr:pyrroloquinoline quinone biosynthesis peptide chaperone PqqD [Candidatus Sulfotelmatobacter sp.]